jgi:hypothetical protein
MFVVIPKLVRYIAQSPAEGAEHLPFGQGA